MEFESAPFPYDGKNPVTGKPFFDVFYDGRFGKRGARGHVYWENESYTDSRVLLSIPKGFDIRKPAVMVVFFHGHGAKVDRDVRDPRRQFGRPPGERRDLPAPGGGKVPHEIAADQSRGADDQRVRVTHSNPSTTNLVVVYARTPSLPPSRP